MVASVPIASNPAMQETALDFAGGVLDPGPAPVSPGGAAGYLMSKAIEKLIGN